MMRSAKLAYRDQRLSPLMVKRKSTQKRSARDKIADKMLLWKPDVVAAEMAQEKLVFRERGIKEGKYAERGVYGATYALFLSAVKRAIYAVLAAQDANTAAQALFEVAVSYYVDARLSRVVLAFDGRSDYARMAREHIAMADLNLVLGLHQNAEWLYREFLAWPDGKQRQGDYVDPEIIELTKLTARLWFDGITSLQKVDAPSFGRYAPLIAMLVDDKYDPDYANRFITERGEVAASYYTDRDDAGDEDEEGLTFYGDVFIALFPIEVLALLSAYGRHRPTEVHVNDPFGASLLGLDRQRAELDDFYAEVEGFAGQLERKLKFVKKIK